MKVGNVWFGGGAHIWGSEPDTAAHWIRDPDEIKAQDLIVLHGGEDISPKIYGQISLHAHADNALSERDEVEMACIQEAVRKGIPIFGICRGAQLLCAYAGGSLFQHVTNHSLGNMHQIITNTGEVFLTNSAHHQMMRLNKEGVLLASTPHQIARFRWADGDSAVESDEPEVEAAWWPSLNAVGVQGHPEWLSENTMLVKYARHIVQEYLRVQIGV